ncbi:MAG TPA: ActS/PrrB/RegB family redox-sensitive histidine kinase [Vitreimonas sp.]|uniref:ActS/PrrB/RegB family redox-sensitive histidine kinase n=1 Tax=Vitreimonas sp. TaxID=3069702 RepID=UPI002D58B40C|nr:ActS/PrrB/RegB family redox-sensitive histidine kinase [Vitreimonas sp.]HYD88434.1 ActS/PrrB/RegB family redox-sensitive histidine kinase [Vitreimonas sp.]
MTTAQDVRAPAPGPSFWIAQSRVRLRTLILLRWLAVIGQTAAVLFVRYGLDVEFPFEWALAAIGASVALNLGLIATRRSQELAKEWEAAALLAYDSVQLAVLLALSGGLQNPFVFLFIAPVAVSATILRPTVTAMLAALTFICVGVISVWRFPLPWPQGAAFELPQLYQLGIAAAVLVGLGFTSVYAWRVAAEEERLNIALAAVQAVLAREQTLSALGGLAAAAAHELGTPLATIHLVAKEMAREAGPDDPHAEDFHLLVTQSERCRAILGQLSAMRDRGDVMVQRAPIRVLLEEVVGPHEGLGPEIHIDAAGEGPLEVKRMPEIVHALGGFVENAVGFANARVDIEARWDAASVEITVRDDGPGFSGAILSRLGEPYLTERDREGAAGGLGLGFFISKTLLERTGATLEVRNRRPPNQGAMVKARWERTSIEAPSL